MTGSTDGAALEPKVGAPHPLELYRWAVQDPITHARVLAALYAQIHPDAGEPLTLREDFAGTSADAVAWVGIKSTRRAIAMDLDADTLAWAARRARRLLGQRAAHLELVQGDSTRVAHTGIDIVSVLNFSIFYLKDRGDLLRYLAVARASLRERGVLVMNVFGGKGALRPHAERVHVTPATRWPREVPIAPFHYVWDVERWDERSRTLTCKIHFELADGPVLQNAFRYDWRAWSPEELTAACREVGFGDAQVFRHTHDPKEGARLGPVSEASLEGLDAYSVYICASR